jgi:hypothetical protein
VVELEHTSVAEVFITNDPKTGTWGIGPGWEAPLDYLDDRLDKCLRGELPDAPATEWWEPTPEDAELGNRRGHAWAVVIEAALAASRTETTSAQERV